MITFFIPSILFIKYPGFVNSLKMLSFNLYSQNINFETNLPLVFIETDGLNIPDDPKIPAKMGIKWNEDGHNNKTSDPFNHFYGNITIEKRGSSSQKNRSRS